jgi:hypothetical protein
MSSSSLNTVNEHGEVRAAGLPFDALLTCVVGTSLVVRPQA